MSEDEMTPTDEVDIHSLSLDELRVEAARLLERYHAASDPDEMLDLSTRYTKVDMLIEGREGAKPMSDDTPEDDDPFALPPLQDAIASEPEVPVAADAAEDEAPESTPDDAPVAEAEPDADEDEDDGPFSGLPPLSAIGEPAPEQNDDGPEVNTSSVDGTSETVETVVTNQPLPNSSDFEETLASLNAAISNTPEPMSEVQEAGASVEDSEADLFDIEKDFGEANEVEQSPIDIQMEAPQEEADPSTGMPPLHKASDFDDGIFNTPFHDGSPDPSTSDTKPEVPVFGSDESGESPEPALPDFSLGAPEGAPAQSPSGTPSGKEDDSTQWEVPPFDESPSEAEEETPEAEIPSIPPLMNSSNQEQNSPPQKKKIPPSISEELPKLALGDDKRICARCGEATDIGAERCGSCSHEDPSLGVVHAVIAGDTRQVAALLKAKPAIVHVITSTHGWTLLHMAASGGNLRLVKTLLDAGAQVNAQNSHGKSALHYAASKGHLPIIHLLLERGADKTLKFDGKTPYELAVECGTNEAVTALQN